jgi:hypothetical protein
VDIEERRFGLEEQTAKRDNDMKEAQRAAGVFQYLDGLPPAQRDAEWQRIRTTEDGFRDLTPDLYDYNAARNRIMAKATTFMSPMDRRSKEADLALKGAQTSQASAQADYYRGQTNALTTGGGFKSPKDRADAESSVRKEYAGLAKPYFETRDAFSRIEQAASQPSAAGDLALIFNYMKMLDPGSVVREGEFATAQNAAGVPDRISNLYNRVLSGERLGEGQRKDFVGQARGLFQRQERQYQHLQGQYRGIAERTGLDTRNVMLDYGVPPDVGAPTGNTVPHGAVQLLQTNPTPDVIQQFEQKYGRGSAAQHLRGR